jgi:hypothetical protein
MTAIRFVAARTGVSGGGMIMNRANGALRIDGSEHRAPESPERVQRGVSFCDAPSILVIDAVVNTGLAAEVGMETNRLMTP